MTGRCRSSTAGLASLVLSATAFVPASAGFAAALLLIFLAVPLALFALTKGSWRIAALSLYFAVSTISVSPVISASLARVEYLIASLGGAGMILGVCFYINYRRSRC